MLRPVDEWFQKQSEPGKTCLLFLRKHILDADRHITETWKYGMPFFCFHGKMICYLWVHKKLHQPYLGIVAGQEINHPDLIQEKRAKMKILLLDPGQDLPIKKINAILQEVLKTAGRK